MSKRDESPQGGGTHVDVRSSASLQAASGRAPSINKGWLGRTLARVSRTLANDDIFIHAAAVAYAAVLSVFPALIAVIAVLSLFVDHVQAQRAVIDALQPYIPPDALELVTNTIEAVVRTRGTAGGVAAVGLLWIATAVAGTLRHALNRVLRAAQSRTFWRRKLVEFTMVLLGGGFVSISVIIPAVQAAVTSVPALAEASQTIRTTDGVILIAAYGPWVFSTAAFLVVYRFLPDVRMSWRSLLAGSVTAMLLFEATKRVFFWYLRSLGSYPLIYGPLAGLIVFMLWMYLVALLVLLGAEVMRAVQPTHP